MSASEEVCKSFLEGMPADTALVRLSDAAEKRLENIKRLYPDQRSAVMAALYIAQEELGHISHAAVNWVSDRMKLPPVQVMEVASFYTMYYKRPVGKYHIQICRTLSCALRGARKLSECVHKRLKLAPGEVSADGKWSFEEVECLGSCGTAPMCEINDTYFENLTAEKLEEILTRIEKEQPDLRFSTVQDRLGDGFADRPKSEVIGGK